MDCLTFLFNKTVALGSSSTGGVRTVQGGLRINYCTTTSERGNGKKYYQKKEHRC